MPTAAEDLKVARTKLFELNREFRAALRDAQNAESPRTPHDQPIYSGPGLAAHRQELIDQVRDTYRPRFISLLESTEAAATLVNAAAERARPTLGTDAGSQMLMQRRWDQARARLDAGIPLRQVIASADLDTLLAAREWAPAYLESKGYQQHRASGVLQPWTPPDTTAVMRAIDERLAEILPDQAAATALRDQLATAPEVDAFRTSMRHMATVVEGEPSGLTDLEAAISAEVAATPPTLDDELSPVAS